MQRPILTLGGNARKEVWYHISRSVRKSTFGHILPAKIQISLCMRTVIGIFTGRILIAKDANVFHADNEL